MKTITQSVEVSFNAVDFQDALTILPVMDDLLKRYNDLNKYLHDAYNESKKEEGERKKYWNVRENMSEMKAVYNQLKVLLKLGFIFSDPTADLFPSQFINMTPEDFK